VRILILNWQDRENPQSGGAEIHLHEIFGRIARSGHDVDLLCGGWSGSPDRATLDGIEVYRAGTRYTYPFVAHSNYRRRLAARQHDVVIEDLNKAPLYTPLWRLPRLVGLVHHLFGSTAFREVAAPLAAALWIAERPIGSLYRNLPFEAVSESTADDLARRGVRRENVRVIYNGVDSTKYTPDATERSPSPRFLYLGRIKRYKGIDILIRAMSKLQDTGAVLEVAGTGGYRPELEKLVASLGLEAQVRFLGFVSEEEKLHLFRCAWACVLASPKEGWGISNMEAAASGTPVVASDSPGIRESVRNAETGFLVPHGDIDAFAAALRRLVNDKTLVARLGDAGRRFAERFTWERSASETIDHLQDVVTRGSS
jgi:glycosyltransferase involved in cell wall biosynthesis